MSTEGGGDRIVSTPEETAGVTAFDRGFEWNPVGRPCHPVAYLLEALPYAAGGVALVVVAAVLLSAGGPAIGGVIQATTDTVDDISLGLPGGDEDVEPGVDARTPTSTAGPTPTATPRSTASPPPSPTPTASPTPSVTETVAPTSTPMSTDVGTPTATVATPDPTPTSTPWPAPAHFAVTIDSTNAPVVEGETLTVDATIRNTGERSDSQTVTLDVGGTERDSEEVSLSGGQSTSVTLSWTTGSGDAGDYTATVESYDDADSRSVTVEHPTPQITQFDVTDESSCDLLGNGDAEYTVTWDTEHTTDSDVTVTLPDGSTESGTSGSTTFSEAGGCGNEYTFEIVAENEGGSDSDSVTDTADGG